MEKETCKPKPILLRDVPCEIQELILKKQTEIKAANPHRGLVSQAEAIYKLILKG